MPLSIVVGGQYGSEGKGKVAQHFARERGAHAVVRVGGTNSGHTTIGAEGEREVFRQLPTAAVDPDVLCVLAAGSYIDLEILAEEIERVELPPHRLVIDPGAMVISPADRDAERNADLGERIGSTCSGTGEAVERRVRRRSPQDLAGAHAELAPYLAPVRPLLRAILEAQEHVIVEGTQGFGLSLIHSPHYPHATSRDTTAAGALSETGLSPLDVRDVILVLRAFPIRVAGASGPFVAPETDWETIAFEGGHEIGLHEWTSVTKKVRRVGRFDPGIVREAIAANTPNVIVMNHLDHVDADARSGITPRARAYLADVEASTGWSVDMVGLGPDVLVPAHDRHRALA